MSFNISMTSPTKFSIEYLHSPEEIDFPSAVSFMEARVQDIIQGIKPELLWFISHPPIYTAGASSNPADVLNPSKFPIYSTDRGGKHTYLGPGQRIIYPILNLRRLHSEQPDVKRFVAELGTWIISALKEFGIKGELKEDRIGVWVKTGREEAKIAAIGIKLRKWISYHGVAINVCPELEHFSGIVPCGISDYGVTSLHALGVNTTIEEFDKVMLAKFIERFPYTKSDK
jgi:lipoyl(octanoyl) transferase